MEVSSPQSYVSNPTRPAVLYRLDEARGRTQRDDPGHSPNVDAYFLLFFPFSGLYLSFHILVPVSTRCHWSEGDPKNVLRVTGG